ncbi:MAG TPA: SMC-Scp complex subunit ScpB [Rubricoccaceae bacterium]|jgi:segregation and condensation protein B
MTPDRSPLERLDFAVEALVFASDAPLRAEDVARAVGEVTGADVAPEGVAASVERLNAEYDGTDRAFRIVAFGGGYRMATVEAAAPFLRVLFAQTDERRLSRSLLETLAVVAYKQPVTKPEVDHVRGVGSDYALRSLLEKDLVALAGRSETVGRPLLYGTTERFLDLFGLGTLDELPRPREIDELLADPRFARERADLLAQLDPPPDAPPEPA